MSTQPKSSSSKGFIYRITNAVNRKAYVGQTKKTAERRLHEHLRNARDGRDTVLCRAIRKYGEASFSVETLEECDREQLNVREKHWIAELRSNDMAHGYNMNAGGNMGSDVYKGKRRGEDHWTYGKPRTPETRAKISASRKGQSVGQDNHMFGKHHTEVTRAKIGANVSRTLKASPNVQRGEDHHRAKLTWKTVREIRATYANERPTYEALGKRFNISMVMAWNIVNRKNWKE